MAVTDHFWLMISSGVTPCSIILMYIGDYQIITIHDGKSCVKGRQWVFNTAQASLVELACVGFLDVLRCLQGGNLSAKMMGIQSLKEEKPAHIGNRSARADVRCQL